MNNQLEPIYKGSDNINKYIDVKHFKTILIIYKFQS